MTARPILFSAPMVRALLEGRKTQTRRVVKLPQANPLGTWEPTTMGGGGIHDSHGNKVPHQGAMWHTRTGAVIGCPLGQPGDLLWVREAFEYMGDGEPASYRADFPDYEGQPLGPVWRPSIHMPRWASRLTLKITDVRVQRVQEISEEDAIAEGIARVAFRPDDGFPLCAGFMVGPDDGRTSLQNTAQKPFANLWDSLHDADGSWGANPWVWAITFEVLRANVDAVLANRETA